MIDKRLCIGVFLAKFILSSFLSLCPLSLSFCHSPDCVSGAVLPSEVYSTQRPQGENTSTTKLSVTAHTLSLFSLYILLKCNLEVDHKKTEFMSSNGSNSQIASSKRIHVLYVKFLHCGPKLILPFLCLFIKFSLLPLIYICRCKNNRVLV